MDTSGTDSKKPNQKKPIGRRLEFVKTVQREGVPASTVAFIIVATAILAFVAGTKSEEFALINNALDGNSENAVLAEDLDYTSVERLYDRLKNSFDGELSNTSLLDGLKKGLAESTGDPYTTYLNAEQAKEFTDDLNGKFSGIGAEIGREGEFIIIVAPLEGYPAEEAGLKPQDIIFKIDGDDAVGFPIEAAVLKIRGENGTDVELTVLRDGEQMEFTVTRATIVVPSVIYEIENGIGVMRITRFAEDTERLAKSAALDFVDNQVQGVILDLRSNSGGFLTSAIDVSGLWLNNLLVAEQREDSGKKVTDSYTSSRGALLSDIPLVVIIDEGSASASEIVTGALRDHSKATVIGATSYGKGSVQNLEELPDGGVLKVTVARWYTPSGDNIDQEGISPDIEVEADADDDTETDDQLQAAIDHLLSN